MIGFAAEEYNNVLTIVPVIFRAGGGKITCNDVQFSSPNSAINYDPSAIAPVTPTADHVSDIWVAKHQRHWYRA